MALQVKIHKQAICVIADESRILGTGFVFLQNKWIVTAKHVVIENGLVRKSIVVVPYESDPVPATLHFEHPEMDLAVLTCSAYPSVRPLLPGRERLIGQHGLLYLGYSPSSSDHEGGATVKAISIPEYRREERLRTETEELIEFDAPEAEGGNSGGPILGTGDLVVGVIVDLVSQSDGATLQRARGTSILSLLGYLDFRAPR